MNFVIRCDVSPKLGFGHLSRCKVLGEEILGRGYGLKYLIAAPDNPDVRSTIQLKTCGEEVEFLPEDISLTDDVECLTKEVGKFLIIDHYKLNNDYGFALKENRCEWLQFDYKAERNIYAKFVLNYNPGVQEEVYQRIVAPYSQLMLGPKYALIRKDLIVEKMRPRTSKNVVVSFGGGDDRGAIAFCVKNLKDLEQYHFHILTTKQNPNLHEIGQLISDLSNFTLHVDSSCYPKLLGNSYAAICAGGTTTFELAYLGVPMIIISIANNQILNAKAWEKLEAACYLGSLDNLVKKGNVNFEPLLNRASSIEHANDLIDGNGARRIIDKVREYAESL